MKALMIAAPASGSGKTTVTLGLIRALKNRGIDICAYKAGPDYIDRAFLETASGKAAGNLDLHLQGETGMAYALSRAQAEVCIIEGVMGYFDGISNTWTNSCYDIARRLNIPTLLVYSPRGEMFSVIPKIKGMVEFSHSNIKAVIFNQVTEHYYQLLKEALEKYTDLAVLGYIPKLEEGVFESRHLGLVQSLEIANLDKQIDSIARVVEKQIDLTKIISLMSVPELSTRQQQPLVPRRQVSVGIARDRAFSFYYRENIELLEDCSTVTFFSPISDEKLPDCDLLYFGGGYPEVFARELADNKSMLKAVKDFGESGGFIFAECGGLMYLSESIENTTMVGLLKGSCKMTASLQRFGYVDVTLTKDCMLGKQGDQFTAHEFHRSLTTIANETCYRVSKTMGDKHWDCGFQTKNIVAGYPHISFVGNPHILNHLLQTIETSKKTG